MDKQTVTLYEYKITDEGMKKTVHEAVVEDTRAEIFYYIESGKSKYPVWVREEHIGKFIRSKIYSLTENDAYYHQMMIEAYEDIVEKRKRDLARDELLLKALKGEIKIA